MKNQEITDEMIAAAVIEYNNAKMAYLEKQYEEAGRPQHKFSPEFCRKMHELCPSIDPETGEVHRDSEN